MLEQQDLKLNSGRGAHFLQLIDLAVIRDNNVQLTDTATIDNLKNKLKSSRLYVLELQNLSPWDIHIWGNFSSCLGADYRKQLKDLNVALLSLFQSFQLEEMYNVTVICRMHNVTVFCRMTKDNEDKFDDEKKKSDIILRLLSDVGDKQDELSKKQDEQSKQKVEVLARLDKLGMTKRNM